MSKTIIGINAGEINSSSCLVRNGVVLAGCPEERFNRQKLTKQFPHGALDYCLGVAGVELNQLDAIAQGWHPGAAWQKFNPMVYSSRSNREAYFYSTPDNLYQHSPRTPGDWIRMESPSGANMPPVYYVQHHRCHAANAFFLSPFEDAAILTCDYQGEFECTTFAIGQGNNIKVLQTQSLPHSLGMLYAAITELLGYKPDSDEWKVMALSALDSFAQGKKLYERLRSTFKLLDGGVLELDQSFYKGFFVGQPNLYTPKLVELLGSRVGQRGETAVEWHFGVAFAMQAAAEEIATHFLCHLHSITRARSLAVAGGFFMNSVFNGKIIDRTPFQEIYVPYAPTDAGNSIGAALYVNHCIFNEPRHFGRNSSQIGPTYGADVAEAALKRRSIRYLKLENPARNTAELLAAGHVVAIMEGAAEFGDRALGHRSILADPRSSVIKDRINSAIKYREAYRPFAPAVLAERVADIFDVAPSFRCPYMEKVVHIRDAWQKRLLGVTHADGSGRVQTVDRTTSPHFYDLIAEFEKITGIPVLLNTSFNVNGEPIVLTPDDAVSTFFNSGIPYLVIDGLLVEK
jgi:carbamoyltransferase